MIRFIVYILAFSVFSAQAFVLDWSGSYQLGVECFAKKQF